jgi:hypothetical protein
MHRIREAMKDDGSPLGGPGMTIESDEAFVGGFKKKRLSAARLLRRRKLSRWSSAAVAPVRSTSRTSITRTFAPRSSPTRTVRRICARTTPASTIPSARVRQPRNHAALNREFSRGDGNHSNTVENFFSILKRGVIGTYHHWSEPTFTAIWPSSISLFDQGHHRRRARRQGPQGHRRQAPDLSRPDYTLAA